MSRQTQAFWAMILIGATFSAGCKPVAPFYVGEHDDLAHYMDVATKLDYPDVNVESLTETTMSGEPLTLSNSEPRELWDMTLEEAIQISLHNSKVLKTLPGLGSGNGTFGFSVVNGQVNPGEPADNLRRLATQPDAVATIYGPALQESNNFATSTQGVESALAAFDAQLTSSFFWDRIDEPQNVNNNNNPFIPSVRSGNTGVFNTELSKRSAAGTQYFFRNNTTYTDNNQFGRALASDWLTNFEAEARQPLFRGAGVQVNRAPVVIARIRGDISLADFEANVRNHVFDTEKAYWELYFAYRNLESQKAQRDSVHSLWRNAQLGLRGGTRNVREEAQARQEYFRSRALVQAALVDLFKCENRLRYLLGLTPTDCRLIRPIDEPMNARVCFDWHSILYESLNRSCELRIKRWQIKQRETELITARNQILPQIDAVALYRWLGRGDDLIASANNPGFPAQGSGAFQELFGGDYQEWRLGVEMATPIGFRRELAGVRNAQLALARECAILKETELELAHEMTNSTQNVDAWYELSQTNFNRRVAAENEVRTLQAAYEEGFGEGSTTLNLLLDALTRRADAQSAFFRSLTNYTVSVSRLHFNKGSLLEYNNVLLAEGPWPQKAYCDAMEQARKRAAGHYLDYGYTRPRVISQGEYPQFQNGGSEIPGEMLHEGPLPTGEEVHTPQPEPADPLPPAMHTQMTSAAPPEIVKMKLVAHDEPLAEVQPVTTLAPANSVRVAAASAGSAKPVAAKQGDVQIKVKGAKFDWGPLSEQSQ